jgi:hypothetical protein
VVVVVTHDEFLPAAPMSNSVPCVPRPSLPRPSRYGGTLANNLTWGIRSGGPATAVGIIGYLEVALTVAIISVAAARIAAQVSS